MTGAKGRFGARRSGMLLGIMSDPLHFSTLFSESVIAPDASEGNNRLLRPATSVKGKRYP